MTSTISKWPIFSVLDEELTSRIRLAIVFGVGGSEAIFITRDDEAFGLGTNKGWCLGFKDKNVDFIHPKKIEALSGIGIKSLVYGHGTEEEGAHVVGLTESGRLFSWGNNNFDQLGQPSIGNDFGLPGEVSGLTNHHVVEVACGYHHTLALTSDGKLLAWGMNSYGQTGSGSPIHVSTPVKIAASGSLQNVVAIACGPWTSMAVTNNGELFAWGDNGNGELGFGNTYNHQSIPKRVDSLANVVVRQVVCGNSHVLALTADGLIYSWGQNSYGQLGTGNMTNQLTPVKVGPEGVKFVEIAAIVNNNLSVAVSDDGKCWAWGQCRNKSVLNPLPVPIASVQDVFAVFGQPAFTYKSIVVSPAKKIRALDKLAEAFDDPKTADLKFIVEGRAIHVHKAVLKIQSQHFRAMFEGDWSESDKDEIELDSYSYTVYHAYLKYLYTDQVDLLPTEAINLLELANSYLEDELKNKCALIIQRNVSTNNAATVYAEASKFEAKELEDFFFKFIIDNLTAVIKSEAFGQLDEENMKKFVKAAGHRVFKT